MYDYAQTFFIDKAKVKGATQVNISRIDLYFKTKPKRGSLNEPNKSGIMDPGIELALVGVNGDGTPNLSNVDEFARVEWGAIGVSGDASQPTSFFFPKEVYIKTDKMYAIYVRFDGMEDYVLWTNKKGRPYVGTTTISPGNTDRLVGNLYITRDRLTADFDPTEAGGSGANQGVNNKASWTAMTDEDLKFEVFVARYRDTGSTNSTANSIVTETYALPTSSHEFILYDAKHSKKENKAHDGERIFQVGPIASNLGVAHTVSVTRGSSVVTSPTANFELIYSNSSDNNYIILVSNNHDVNHVSGDNAKYLACKVISADGNTVVIDKAATFNNSAAYFIVSPVGELDFCDQSKSFNGRYNSPSWYWTDRKKQDLLVLKKSNANLTHRFVNNSIHAVNITSGGSGYANTDYLIINCSSSGQVNAYANVRTNGSGTITAVYLTNAGAGIIATPTAYVMNSQNQPSTGTSAAFSFVEGPWLKSEIKKYVIKDIEVINMEIDAVTPHIAVNNPGGTIYTVKHQLAYYKDSNGDYIVNQNAAANQKLIKNLKKNGLPFNNTPVLVSRSNEVKLLSTQTGNSTHIVIDAVSNNDFTDPCPETSYVYYHRYIINNDYTNEHTSFGNALAKHVSTKITFEAGRQAEDLVVYIRAFRPPSTDLKVYGKIYNSQDAEAFDDKNWTLLDITSGAATYSSPNDEKDVREYTYNLPKNGPKVSILSPGTIDKLGTAGEIVGSGTSFTSELQGFAANDVVKIYDPLFPENWATYVVNNVVSDTSMFVLPGDSVYFSASKIGKLDYKNQAFIEGTKVDDATLTGVAKYYNGNNHVYYRFDTFAIKIVMLSSNTAIIPQIEDIRGIGVSA